MNYSNIKKVDIANGRGCRTSLFVSGCKRHCPGCFNSEAWSFYAGKPYTEDIENDIVDSLKPNYIKGLSILGGEPLESENVQDVLNLVVKVRSKYKNTKDIWLWTGYTFNEILGRMSSGEHLLNQLMHNIDVLVDGPFEQDKKDLFLRFRGSSNQRILDVKTSLLINEPFYWYDDIQYETHHWIDNPKTSKDLIANVN